MASITNAIPLTNISPNNPVENVDAATVVSGYYIVKSRHSIDEYFKWIANFLENIECQLIFFTTADLIPKFKEMRDKNIMKNKTIFIDYPMDKFMAYTRYSRKFWENQHLLNVERSLHSPELYAIWYQKKEFVMEAIKMNPFNSRKFIWCDAGCFRYPEWLPQLKNFGYGANIPKNKMLLLQIKHFTPEEVNKKSPRAFENVDRIGAGVQAGTIDVWKKWDKIYDQQIVEYIKHGKFVGKEQNIMAEIALNYPNFIKAVDVLKHIDIWFSLLFYLSAPQHTKTIRKRKYRSFYPLVSILIPLYNGIEYLGETLDSIKQQTYKNWEVLIGVNGWSQNSEVYQKAKLLCKEKLFIDPICLTINPINGNIVNNSYYNNNSNNNSNNNDEYIKLNGICKIYDFYDIRCKTKTMNRLSTCISGEWISLLDADDIWTPDKLLVQSNYFNTYDVIGSHFSYFGELQGAPSIPLCNISNADFYELNPLGNSCTVFHRTLLTDNHTWNNKNIILDDYELWLKFRYGMKGVKFWNCPEMLMKHRIYKQSAFNNTNIYYLNDFLNQMRCKYPA